MALLTELKRHAASAVAPAIGFCVVAYFAYHSVQGDRGLVAWMRLNENIEIARAEVAGLQAERVALERRVSLLRPDSLDRDLLDEQARIVLNFARPGEIVILERPASGR
jgi:cell division protein FtsB